LLKQFLQNCFLIDIFFWLKFSFFSLASGPVLRNGIHLIQKRISNDGTDVRTRIHTRNRHTKFPIKKA